MKLTIFQSDKGDCLLLEAKSGELILCDGGMGPSMRDHVRDELAKLRDAKKELELVYVSHVDNDHISGVLQLLQDEVEWRVLSTIKKSAVQLRNQRSLGRQLSRASCTTAFATRFKDSRSRSMKSR